MFWFHGMECIGTVVVIVLASIGAALWGCIVGVGCWILDLIAGPSKGNEMSSLDSLEKTLIQTRMKKLAVQIVKYRYCKQTYQLKIMSDAVYKRYCKQLYFLEAKHPNYVLHCSPLNSSEFSEVVAEKVFGYTEWKEVKDTIKFIVSLNKTKT